MHCREPVKFVCGILATRLPEVPAGKGLVTNYGEGGATKREGGAREVLPLQKGGGGKSFSQAEGGAQQVLG